MSLNLPRGRCRHLGLSLALSLLAACAPTIEPVPSAGALPRPTAAPVRYAHMVRFAGESSQLSPTEAERLRTFLGMLPIGRALDLRVMGHTNMAAGQQDEQLVLRRARSVERLVADRAAGSVTVRVGPADTLTAGQVEVEARTYEVVLPGCPDWSRDLVYDQRNLPMSNLGCANAVNLGLMIADPGDLVRTEPTGPADGTHQAEGVVRYRTDKVKELKGGIADP